MKSTLLKGIGYGLAVLLVCNLLTVSRLFFGSLYVAGKWIEANPANFTFLALLALAAGFVVWLNHRKETAP